MGWRERRREGRRDEWRDEWMDGWMDGFDECVASRVVVMHLNGRHKSRGVPFPRRLFFLVLFAPNGILICNYEQVFLAPLPFLLPPSMDKGKKSLFVSSMGRKDAHGLNKKKEIYLMGTVRGK